MPRISRRLLVSIGVGLLVVIGAVTAVVLATAPGPHHPVPAARPAPVASAHAVVPLLGTSADADRAVPAVSASSSSPASPAAAPKVAPLDGLRQADLLIVAPSSLPARVLAQVPRQAGVTSAVPIEAARVLINGTQEAVLGVDPSAFRGYAAGPTAASNPLWQGVADGGVAVSYSMGVLDKLTLGHPVTVTGRQAEQLPLVAFGTVGIGGVDAVVSDSVARSLGMPASNAMVITAPPATVTALAARIKAILPRGASVDPLVTLTTSPSQAGVGSAGAASGENPVHGAAHRHAAGGGKQARAALRLGRRGTFGLRLLGPGPVVVRPGRRGHAAGRRRPGPDRRGRSCQPAGAR